jgi:hypothetical protein
MDVTALNLIRPKTSWRLPAPDARSTPGWEIPPIESYANAGPLERRLIRRGAVLLFPATGVLVMVDRAEIQQSTHGPERPRTRTKPGATAAESFFEHPILNSPYEVPKLHHDLPPLKWSDLRYVFDIKED